MNKRLLSLLLALLMLVSLFPTAALAVREEEALPMEAPAAAEDAALSRVDGEADGSSLAQLPVAELAADDDTPAGNLCRPTDGVTVTARASSEEADTVLASFAIDGDTTSKSSRWGSAVRDSSAENPHWLRIDLGAVRQVSYVRIFWERLNVLAYTLQGSADGTTWTTLHDSPSLITQVNEVLTFAPVSIRYVKVNITSHQATGLKGDGTASVEWNTVSLFEVEVYRDASAVPVDPAPTLDALMDAEGGPLSIDEATGKVVLTSDVTIPQGLTASFAANLEQVVGADGTIYTPVVDTVVNFDITVTNAVGQKATSPGNSPISLTIPGEHTTASNNGNEKPAVIPEIMEWYSPNDSAEQSPTHPGYYGKSYTFPANKKVRILHRYALDSVAVELAADLKELFGVEAEMYHLSDKEYSTLRNIVKAGDIVLFDMQSGDADTRGRVRGYDDETYGMEIYDDKVYIYATHPTGAYWGTRTLLQGLKLAEADSGAPSFPNGTLRDYPEFKVRGFVFDVGRKPISMDMLKKFAKNMAWYKLNDFHVHLNDNLIFFEDYKEQTGWKTNEDGSFKLDSNNNKIPVYESWDNASVYDRVHNAYAGFRLESDIQEEKGASPLASRDYHYSKAEYKTFVEECAQIGINVVSEIDVPAHAKAITDAFPSIRLHGYSGDHDGNGHTWNDHLDLSDAKYSKSLAIAQEIFDEYIDAGVFGSTVDFGADEYYASHPAYRRFVTDMIDHLSAKDGVETVRLWGSLSTMSGNATQYPAANIKTEGVQMNIWNTGWANPQQMYNLGFDLINTTDGPFYMVPNGGGGRGGYGDYLNLTNIYNKAPNQIGDTWFPASSSQILGMAYAIWGDSMLDTRSSGLNEVDVFDRFYDVLPVIAVRQWGVGTKADGTYDLDRTLEKVQADAAKIGTAPGTNPYYEVAEEDSFSYDFTDESGLTLTNADVDTTNHLLALNGGSSYAETGLDRLGWGSQLTFKVYKLPGGSAEQVIFESDHLSADSTFAYNEQAIKALPGADADHWKLGFSRELHDYEFPVELPVGEWVRLTLTNTQQSTTLSVNGGAPVAAVGKLVAKPDSNNQFKGKTGITNSSFELPVARIGSKTNALVGYVAAVSNGAVADAFLTASAPSEANSGSDGPASNVVDGKTNTYWHSNYNNSSGNPVGNGPVTLDDSTRYIEIQLAQPATVAGLRHLCRQSGGNNGKIAAADIKVSTSETVTEGSDAGFTTVASVTGWSATANTYDKVTFEPQENVRYVRIYGTTTTGGFMSAAEIELIYGPLTDDTVDVTLGNVSWNAARTEATVDLTVTLKPSGVVLAEDTDFTVAYTNNTAAGTATVTITGAGDYSGSVSKTFTVPAKPPVYDLTSAVVTFPKEFYPLENGKAEAKPVVKVGAATLREGLDYTLAYTGNTSVGAATVTATGIAPNTGSASGQFQVVLKKSLSSSKAKVLLNRLTYVADGKPQTPAPTVSYDGTRLTRDVDYTLSYSRNVAPGTATITVTGIGLYEGKATIQFTIKDPENLLDLSDVTKTKVVFDPAEYAYTGRPIIPTFSVTYGGARLYEGRDFEVELSNNVNGGTGVLVIRGVGNYSGPFVATFTITGGGTGGSGSSGGSSGGGSTTTTTTTNSKQPDGASVTTKTDSTGAMTSTASYPDGTKVTTDIPVTGPITAAVTVPASAEKVTVTIPTRTAPTPGQIAVILHPDGTEEIIKTAQANEAGLAVTLEEDALIQVVDNTRVFDDVPADSWAKDAITFVTSREIFNGTGGRTFSPADDMSRAMVCTVLANLAGQETKGGAIWYEKALNWAKDNGISDGTTPDAIVTREQLAAMLYRYAGSPASEDALPERFTDTGAVSDWAAQAMAWAVKNDLLRGRSNLDGLELAPKATATRAEVAAVFQRYVALLK